MPSKKFIHSFIHSSKKKLFFRSFNKPTFHVHVEVEFKSKGVKTRCNLLWNMSRNEVAIQVAEVSTFGNDCCNLSSTKNGLHGRLNSWRNVQYNLCRSAITRQVAENCTVYLHLKVKLNYITCCCVLIAGGVCTRAVVSPRMLSR
jgi:hypothetical protein